MQNNRNAPAEATFFSPSSRSVALSVACATFRIHQLDNQHIGFLDALFKVPSLQDIKAS
ncbi:hypothetical protein BDR04DRAFT_1087623 [Suillus decipiens]|nr:hypothetical protein BDR04DRAFT_1087623 [Suillus decipiens]